VQITAGTLTVVGTPKEITMLLVAFVAHHWDWFGVQQELVFPMPAFLLQPVAPQLLDQQP